MGCCPSKSDTTNIETKDGMRMSKRNILSTYDDKLTARVILIGEAAVGKTSIVNRFVLNHFLETDVTLGMEAYEKDVCATDPSGAQKNVKLLVFDTEG